jgi:hypothetical protein
MNAKTRDLEAGWGVYKASGFAASLDDINAALLKQGFNPISDRSYRHFKKLAKYGYERYVPINQLDVETLRDPVWDTPLRHRYLARPTKGAVSLVFVLGDLLVLRGELMELSDLEATVVLRGAAVKRLGPQPTAIEGISGLVVLGPDERGRPVFVEAMIESPEGLQLHLSFLEVVPADRVEGRRSLPTSSLHLIVTVDDSQYLLNTVRTLNLLTEAIEATRIVCDEALVHLDPGGTFVLTPPEIVTLERSNPVVLVVSLSIPAIAVFGAITSRIVKWRKKWHEGSITKAQAKVIEQQAELVGQQVELAKEFVRSQRIANDRGDLGRQLAPSLVSGFVLDQVQQSLTASGGSPTKIEISISESSEESSEEQRPRIEKLVEHQLIPAMTKLFEAPVTDIVHSAGVAIPDLPDPPAEDDDG